MFRTLIGGAVVALAVSLMPYGEAKDPADVQGGDPCTGKRDTKYCKGALCGYYCYAYYSTDTESEKFRTQGGSFVCCSDPAWVCNETDMWDPVDGCSATH